MSWYRLLNPLPLVRRGAYREQDLADELSAHLDLQARKHQAAGLDREEAYRRARIEFGSFEEARESCRDVSRWSWLDAAGRNFRHSLRSLARNPAFAAVSILLLTFGIGANVAVFSTIDALFLRPLPVHDPGQLVEIFSVDKRGTLTDLFSGVLDPLSRNRAFSGVCGVATHYDAVEIDKAVQTVGTAAFSGTCFQTLGISMELGRAISPADDRINAEPVAVITDALWRSRFGARADILGRTIRIGTDEYTIIGVTRRPFTGLLLGFPEPVMIPLLAQPDFTPSGARPTTYYVSILARRAPGVSEAKALASIRAERQALLEESVPHHFNAARRREYLERSLALGSARSGLDYFLRRRFGEPVFAIFVLCAAMLLIACVNLCSLLLARSLRRQREIGIRLALGAGGRHIAIILALENVILVLIGAICGVVGGIATARLILARGSQVFGNFDLAVGFDLRVVLFVLAAVGILIAAFVITSVWQARRLSHADAMKQGGRGIIASHTAGQKILLAVQISLTLALVAGSALFAASVRNMYRIDFGIEPQNVWIARLDPVPGGYRDPAYWKRTAPPYYRDLLNQIEALLDIASAAFTDATPFQNAGWRADVIPLEGDLSAHSIDAHVIGVSDNFFRTLGNGIMAGEDFQRAPGAQQEPGVILSESLARQFGDTRALIGRHLRIGTQPDLQRLKITGVARDMDMDLSDLGNTHPALAFIDFWQHQNLEGYPVLLIKTRSAVLDADAIRRVVARNGHEFIQRFSAVTSEIDNALIENRFLAWLSGAFSLLALWMTAVGLFGLLSYQVSNCTAEIGIRLALGARPSQIAHRILAQITRLVLFGMMIGIALTFAVQKLLTAFLYGVTVYNPLILIATVLVLILVAAIAALIPTRRALRIDPVEALRHE